MRHIVVAIGVAFLLAACGGQGDKGTAQPGASTTSMARSTTTTPLRIAGNDKVQAVGKPFAHPLDEAGFQVTLTVRAPVSCGATRFAIPADPFTGEAAYLLRAGKGFRFCQLDLMIKNTGKKHLQFTPGGYLYDEHGAQYEADSDATNAVANAVTAKNRLQFGDATVDVNPSETSQSAVVFAIPVGAAPTKVELADDGVTINLNNEVLASTVAIMPSDVKWVHPRGT